MSTRTLIHVIESMPTSDGAGVKLRRSVGSQRGLYVDPFLMLDEFYSDDPDDYLAGFPAHPHRGFETVTYMLDGHMRHEDHMGNRGDLGPGDVQWMTAAHGIIHSEMPQQSAGTHARLPAVAESPCQGKDAAGTLSRYPRQRRPAALAAAGRQRESHCRCPHARRDHCPRPRQRSWRQAQHRSPVSRCTPAGWS